MLTLLACEAVSNRSSRRSKRRLPLTLRPRPSRLLTSVLFEDIPPIDRIKLPVDAPEWNFFTDEDDLFPLVLTLFVPAVALEDDEFAAAPPTSRGPPAGRQTTISRPLRRKMTALCWVAPPRPLLEVPPC